MKFVFWRIGLCWGMLALGGVSFCRAQTFTNDSADLATPLGALGASARADALGDALVGLADDPSALFFNGAGLAQLQGAALSVNHNSYLAGTFEETLLFGMPVGSLGGWAAAIQYVGWGSLDERDANGVHQGTFSDSDVGLSAGWGIEVVKNFSVGFALHATQQKIVDSIYTDLSGDLGALYMMTPDVRLGLAFTGLGTSLAGSALAEDVHFGLSDQFHLSPASTLISTVAGYWEPNGVSKIQGGLEAAFDQIYFFRLGCQCALANNGIEGLTGLTAGAGLKIGNVSLDYAYLPYGDLGTSHRISLGYEFPNPVSRPVTVLSRPVTVVVTPVSTPAPMVRPGPAKATVEVHFELPQTLATPETSSAAATLLETYEMAAQRNPNDSHAWRNLGVAYFKAGKTDLALQCFSQALRLNPGDVALKKWVDDYLALHPDQP